MSEEKLYPVSTEIARAAHITNEQYLEMYKRSIEDSDAFWSEQAERFVTWFKPWDTVQSWDYGKAEIRWFEGGRLNVSYNCIDRHLDTRAEQTAIIWEGDDPGEDIKISYRELHEHVCRLSNALKKLGVKKGDRVCIYMPMVPEAAYAMLACTRIGAVHSVVFGGFSAESLRDRITDSSCKVLITADQGPRAGRKVPLKENADKACGSSPSIEHIVVVKRGGDPVEWVEGRDLW